MISRLHEINGGCHCGNVTITAGLTAAPATYHPRACDCDFCRKHGAAWISDANGSLSVEIKNAQESGAYRQGSGQAEFLLCRNCGVLVCVTHRVAEKLYAAVNVQAFPNTTEFAPRQPVSPQKLSPADKTTRWQSVWFSTVNIIS